MVDDGMRLTPVGAVYEPDSTPREAESTSSDEAQTGAEEAEKAGRIPVAVRANKKGGGAG